jgi:hypothetical protein
MSDALAVCTVTTSAVNFGTVTVGKESRAIFSSVANCDVTTPYSYSFNSLNGGITGGKLVSGSCTLNYSIVSYAGGVYGTTDYFVSPPPGLVGSGIDQTTALGVVIPAVQNGCILTPGAAAIIVTDTLTLSVNY